MAGGDAPPARFASDAVVHVKFDRRRSHLPTLHIVHLQFDVRIDLVVGEHAALGENRATLVEATQRLAQRRAHRRHLLQLLGRQIVQVLVHRRARVDAIFDAIRAALGDLPIVAEDLGIITPAVEQLRERQGIPGMRVLQFDIAAEQFDPDAIPENCVCYTGTHDNDTTVGWFRGNDAGMQSAEQFALLQERVLATTGGSAATIHHDLIRLAFGSAAKLAVVPMQDYLGLGSAARLNLPGTLANNWRWRLLPAQLTPELFDSVSTMATLAGRNATRS